MISELKAFLLRGNVIDLAVAVVIGTAFIAIVTAIVEGILNPLIALIVGANSIDEATFAISGTDFLYGRVIGATINFVLVGTILFFFVKAANRLMEARRREETEEVTVDETPEEIVLLREIRDRLSAPPAR
ncbi:large conductance mechanosensitive channel protein MscL [Euzebya sp.]|uniref:large conductance mechanosensitive channel protein MscL n=1 Tax=Euzebya sp. TaxID=1971409 RepID=UPI0035199A65